MHDPPAVGGGEPLGDAGGDLRSLPSFERAPREHRAQGLAFEQLRDHVGDSAFSADVVDRHDVRMRQGCDGLRLALEASERRGVVGQGLGQNLDRDFPCELRVSGAIHLSHPSRSRGAPGSRSVRGGNPVGAP